MSNKLRLYKRFRRFFQKSYTDASFEVQKKMEYLALFNVLVIIVFVPVAVLAIVNDPGNLFYVLGNITVPLVLIISLWGIRSGRPEFAINMILATHFTTLAYFTGGFSLEFTAAGGALTIQAASSQITMVLMFQLVVISFFAIKKYQLKLNILISFCIILTNYVFLRTQDPEGNILDVDKIPVLAFAFLTFGSIISYLIFSLSSHLLKLTEKSLGEVKEFNQRIINALPDGFLLYDQKGTLSYASARALKMLGFQPDTVIPGRNLLEFIHREDRNKVRDTYLKALKHNHDIDVECRFIRKDGTCFTADLRTAAAAESFGQVQSLISFLRDMTEQKRTEEELNAAKEAAETATRAKSEFLANMSHEIRTPMNAIIGMAELAVKNNREPKVDEFLQIIDNSSKSLLFVINDILDFSKIEAGKLELESDPYFLTDILEELSDTFRKRASEKDIELIFSTAPDVPRALVGDSHRMIQLLTNLVSNAVKYTEDGEIIVSVTCESKTEDTADLEFSVSDTGIGIDEEILPHLFDAFTQADGSTTRKFGGTGLGLAICKSLVELMGGTIRAESEKGTGSLFAFSLTLKRQLKEKEVQRVVPGKLSGMKALVIDDNLAARTVLKDILESFSFSTDTADSGESGIELLHSERSGGEGYGLILLDWKMPGLNGLETAELIKKDPELQSIPIILMTAFNVDRSLQDEHRDIIDAMLIKPIKPSSLFDTIVRLSSGEEEGIITKQSLAMDAVEGRVVLLAEDNVINQKVVIEIMKEAGVKVEIAETGREAVEAVKRKVYDAVLMDVQMPEMDGYEASRQIRNTEGLEYLPIIAMTANAMKGDKEKCLAAGMNDTLLNPLKSTSCLPLSSGGFNPVREMRQQEIMNEKGG